MIHQKLEPQSPEWFLARAGIPTSSEFDRIITPGGKPSRQADAYLYSLLAEYIVGHPILSDATEWMQRGQDLEDEAIKAYEFERDIETEPGGFWTTDDGLAGCSPDRLVGTDGLLEIKCPKPNTQAGYLLTGKLEEDYYPQLQGQLWITERAWVEIVSYHPEMPAAVMRVPRDEKYISLLSVLMETFRARLIEGRIRLNERYGPFPPIALSRGGAPEPQHDEFGISDEDLEVILAAQQTERTK